MENGSDFFAQSRARKLKIFHGLSAGIMKLDDIHRTFFKKPDGSIVCQRVFNRNLLKLKNDEYIDIFDWREISYRSGVTRLAFLQERGADYLCLNSKLERDHIRIKLPRIAHMRHELNLSNIIRFIRLEEGSKKTFQIGYLYDDLVMKRLIKESGNSREKLFYPDLRGRFIFKTGSVTFNIELDCGSKGKSYWCRKIGSWGDPTLLISLNAERARLMANYATKTARNGIVCAVSLNEFYSVGITYFKEALLSQQDRGIYLYGANI